MPTNAAWPYEGTPELPVKICSPITIVRVMKKFTMRRMVAPLPSGATAKPATATTRSSARSGSDERVTSRT